MSRVGGTKTAVAYATIRADVESGRIKPGDRLLVDPLCSALGMSPTPIREALRLLEAEGLVVSHPHRGATVATHDAGSVEELYWLRATLEPMAAARAARLRTDEQALALKRIHLQMVDAQTVDFAPLNSAWHEQLFAMAQAPMLKGLIEQLWTAWRVNAMWRSTQTGESVAEHGAITDAIFARDAEQAEWLMRRHIQAGAKRALAQTRQAEEAWPDAGGSPPGI